MKIKNWKEFQHFKDRRPPWIKLHRDILERRDINKISDCAFRLLVCLWLLASEDKKMEGNLMPIEDIAFRLRKTEDQILKALQELTHFIDDVDINTISECHQVDEPETETEAYKEEIEEETKTPASGGGDMDFDELKKTYSETFRDLLPTKVVLDRLQWMIDNFSRDDILSRFEGAASAKAKSLRYITNGMVKELETKQADADFWESLPENNDG